ncbi:MAG: hypothetical protein AAGF12_16620 [Myxococcota bacterium]
MRLVREALEGLVAPRLASGVIFDALAASADSELPRNQAELLAFVAGPLSRAAERRVGGAQAREMVRQIETVLSSVSTKPQTTRVGRTLEVPIGGGPVVVLLLSRVSGLAVALRAAVGGERLGVRTVADAATATGLALQLKPDLLIVDATNPTDDSVEEVADVMSAVGPTCARLLWGHEERWAQALGQVLTERKVRYTPVDRREGVDPLLDLVRSRLGA